MGSPPKHAPTRFTSGVAASRAGRLAGLTPPIVEEPAVLLDKNYVEAADVSV